MWTELIRSSDDSRSIFSLAEVTISRTLKEKKSICPIYKNAHISWTLWATPMIFCRKTDFTKRNQAKKVGLLKMSPTGPTSPIYQMKKRKSGITFEWVSRFGWNFAWKLLKSIYITSMKKSLAEQIYTYIYTYIHTTQYLGLECPAVAVSLTSILSSDGYVGELNSCVLLFQH